jgi:hypothetical protein
MREGLFDLCRVRHGSARGDLLHYAEQDRTEPRRGRPVRQHYTADGRELHRLPAALRAIHGLQQHPRDPVLLRRDLFRHLLGPVLRPEQRVHRQDLLQVSAHARPNNHQDLWSGAVMHRNDFVRDLSNVSERRDHLHQRQRLYRGHGNGRVYGDRLPLQLQHGHHHLCRAARMQLESRRSLFGHGVCVQHPFLEQSQL